VGLGLNLGLSYLGYSLFLLTTTSLSYENLCVFVYASFIINNSAIYFLERLVSGMTLL